MHKHKQSGSEIVLQQQVIVRCAAIPFLRLLSFSKPLIIHRYSLPSSTAPPSSVFPFGSFNLLLPISSSIIRLEKVSSQPPPWRGGGVFLAIRPMHAIESLKKSTPHSSKTLPTLTGMVKKKKKKPYSQRGLQICPSLVEFTSVRNMNTRVKRKCE